MANILLIEPDHVLAGTYRQFLEDAGHSVQVSQSAQSAVRGVDTNLPDVIVLELQLANHNGIEFLYEFRSYPEWQAIPLILHTMIPARALQLPETVMNELNIRGLLYKPSTNLDKLRRTIDVVLQASPAAAS